MMGNALVRASKVIKRSATNVFFLKIKLDDFVFCVIQLCLVLERPRFYLLVGSFRISFSSPLSCMAVTISLPPINSPFT